MFFMKPATKFIDQSKGAKCAWKTLLESSQKSTSVTHTIGPKGKNLQSNQVTDTGASHGASRNKTKNPFYVEIHSSKANDTVTQIANSV